MSKGKGEKIAIKFTEEIIGDIYREYEDVKYKHYRWYITSTWSSDNRMYLYELEIYNEGQKIPNNNIISKTGSSRYSFSYDVDKLFDGAVPGTEWDANGSLPHWVKIELKEPMAIDYFRWHTSTGINKPRHFKLQGSIDGTNWTDLYESQSPNTDNWIEFTSIIPNEKISPFTITGKEEEHVKGKLIDKKYSVTKTERHPTEEKTIILIVNDKNRFNNADGNLTVSYNSTIGTLQGEFGVVQSFTHAFTPTDLIRKPIPHVIENINISNLAKLDFIKVSYKNSNNKENISVSLGKATVDFIPVSMIEV